MKKWLVALCRGVLGLFVGLCCLYLAWVALHPVWVGDYQGHPRWNPTARWLGYHPTIHRESLICRSYESRWKIWCLFGWRFDDVIYYVDADGTLQVRPTNAKIIYEPGSIVPILVDDNHETID